MIIPVDQFVRSDVPNHDGAPAILAFGYEPFEVEVIERMIFRGERAALFSADQRHTFGHRPRFEDVIHLEPEIVMQMAGGMFLHHETAATPLRATRRQRGAWLGRATEIALGGIVSQAPGRTRGT